MGEGVEVHFAPLKDPVRAYEKAHDDYADRFKKVDDVSPLSCIVDVLRCAVEVTEIAEVSSVMKNFTIGLKFVHDGQEYCLELIRAKNKFAPDMLCPVHNRNVLLNVRLTRLSPGAAAATPTPTTTTTTTPTTTTTAPAATKASVFGEVQIKVKSIKELLHDHKSHEHYEYFRSLLEGNVDVVDELLIRLLSFVDQVCQVPVLLSLLIVVMDTSADSAKEKGALDRWRSVVLKKVMRRPHLWLWALHNINMATHQKVGGTAESGAAGEGESGSNESGVKAKLPLDRNVLYNIAIEKLLHRWNPILAPATMRALSHIAQHNVFERNNQRVFEQTRDVRTALRACDKHMLHCWTALQQTPASRRPLIKSTVVSETNGKYQFLHLSLQEHLVAVKVMSAPAGATQVIWEVAHDRIRGVKSQPLCNAVVLSCLKAGSVVVCARACTYR